MTKELVAWARNVATSARDAVDRGEPATLREKIDRLELAARQLGRIAEQEGARPNYDLHKDVHMERP